MELFKHPRILKCLYLSYNRCWDVRRAAAEALGRCVVAGGDGSVFTMLRYAHSPFVIISYTNDMLYG